MSSYRNNYNNSSESSYGSSSNYNNSSSSIPSSKRPDGSYREEIKVRPGHVPEAERQNYAPPHSRTSNHSGYSSGNAAAIGAADLVDSWADMDAPVLSEYSESESNVIEDPESKSEIKSQSIEVSKPSVEVPKLVEAPKLAEASTALSLDNSSDVESNGSPAPREPRKPSQLATAIDTAIETVSNVSGISEASRPIGRFAAQIANDERDGRTYTPRRYDSSTSNHNYRTDYNQRGYSRSGYNNNSRSNWNRDSSFNNNMNRDSVDEAPSAIAAISSINLGATVGISSGEIRVEKEFKSFLEQLNALRREMAVINAKLEYIRYFKSLDTVEMNKVERARVLQEKDLLTRMDAIFEAFDALNQ